MTFAQYDVVIVGAGCAGLTAALGLARAGFAIAVVEAEQVGGSGPIGGVCFAENLVEPDILGADGVEALAWERRLIERGSFATDGRRLAGNIYRHADAFRHCYTVLRPLFDHHFAEIVRKHGVALFTETTVESLIREGRRIIGVATTRGPLYGELIFLAEGDAGHLVSREGLDRSSDPRDNPAFLYCLQQVVDLPPGALEQHFRVGAEQGVVYDFLLRNPGRMPLNARGLLCSNRQGLTLSVVLPAKNLRRWFKGDPRQLLDWFVDMPALRPWLRDGRRGAWTATLLRAGGLRDVPYLVEDGLAVGGAAAGLGVDFPMWNLMGPATATGLLLSRAAARIRDEGRAFDREALARHYLEPLQQTRYWRDMVFLQRWPSYLRRTHVLFDRGVDFLLDSSAVWARSRRWLPWKLLAWLGVLSGVSGGRWNELRDEFIQLGRALRLREVTPRPALTRILLDGALNAFRDLARRPRPHLPPYGTLRLYYHSAEEEGRASAVPLLFRRWFERFRPVLAAAGHALHANDDMPLSAKLTRTIELLVQQINLFDLVAVAGLTLLIVPTSTVLAAWSYVFHRLRRRPAGRVEGGGWRVEGKGDPNPPPSTLHPPLSPPPLIHVVWRSTQPPQQAASVQGLPHICPAGVFEITGTPPQTVRIAVHAERCIFCEACWRTNPLVDWGRNGTASPLPSLPAAADGTRQGELESLLDQLEYKLQEFDVALIEGPAAVDRPHNDYLEMLARYAHKMTIRIREVLKERTEPLDPAEAWRQVMDLADALVARADERTRRTWNGRFAWAAADGRLLRQHHLTGLRRLLRLPAFTEKLPEKDTMALPTDWIPAVAASHAEDACIKHLLANLAARRYLQKTLEQTENPATESVRAELLAMLLADVRDGLTARTDELNVLLGGGTSRVNPENAPVAAEVYRRHGRRLLVDPEETRKLLDVPGDWATLSQRGALRAEREEILEAERRLLALAADWREASRQPEDDDKVSAGFARQAAHVLAGKVLLWRTFARLEKGSDAELTIVLLRVWLDDAATLLDEYTIVVRDRLRPAVRHEDRPLVEPDSGAPLRTQAEYLATPATYTSGDFLLAPIDLRQSRLVPEMLGEELIALVNQPHLFGDLKDIFSENNSSPNVLYLMEALTVEIVGHRIHEPSCALDLEMACVRLVLAGLRQAGDALRERCLILQALAGEVMPRWPRGGIETGVRHLERDVLELEALKANFRQRLTAVWQVFGEALRQNADVQASCFALAEAAAWLKAADSTLGRMAWLSRLCQVEDRVEPPAQQELGHRVLAHCFAEIRDRLFRFDEDLASLRRGYYAPHVHAATLLLRSASH